MGPEEGQGVRAEPLPSLGGPLDSGLPSPRGPHFLSAAVQGQGAGPMGGHPLQAPLSVAQYLL